jgi:hypothetical protein
MSYLTQTNFNSVNYKYSLCNILYIRESIFIYPTDSGEITKIIKRLSNSTAQCNSYINNKKYQKNIYPLNNILGNIINKMIDEKTFPLYCTNSHILPIYKNVGDHNHLTNTDLLL